MRLTEVLRREESKQARRVTPPTWVRTAQGVSFWVAARRTSSALSSTSTNRDQRTEKCKSNPRFRLRIRSQSENTCKVSRTIACPGSIFDGPCSQPDTAPRRRPQDRNLQIEPRTKIFTKRHSHRFGNTPKILDLPDICFLSLTAPMACIMLDLNFGPSLRSNGNLP